MPRDVTTRWNSTYDMLAFAVEYKKQIKELTSDLTNDLRAYELSREEWQVAEELRDSLKVRVMWQSHVTRSLVTLRQY
jgi:hypothetical protein